MYSRWGFPVSLLIHLWDFLLETRVDVLIVVTECVSMGVIKFLIFRMMDAPILHLLDCSKDLADRLIDSRRPR